MKNLGIYDFMGIIAPGEVFVAYYYFTYSNVLDKIINSDIISKNQIFIIIFTIGAYILGVVLHELGRIISDCFNLFNARKILTDINHLPKESVYYRINPLNNIKEDFSSSLKNFYVNIDDLPFEKVVSKLKYADNNSTKRIDIYHSVYAFARSTGICFFAHLISIIVYLISHLNEFKLFLVLSIIDSLLIFICFIRAKRYYYLWVKNIYIQYAQLYL